MPGLSCCCLRPGAWVVSAVTVNLSDGHDRIRATGNFNDKLRSVPDCGNRANSIRGELWRKRCDLIKTGPAAVGRPLVAQRPVPPQQCSDRSHPAEDWESHGTGNTEAVQKPTDRDHTRGFDTGSPTLTVLFLRTDSLEGWVPPSLRDLDRTCPAHTVIWAHESVGPVPKAGSSNPSRYPGRSRESPCRAGRDFGIC